jgi:ABC-type multidrug transport system ATPase subunit
VSRRSTRHTHPITSLITADRLGLRTRRGWVFRGVDLDVRPGSVTALAGQAGSGRSMLLLTLAGRARPTEGRLTVDDTSARPRIRRLVSVARVTGATELEPELRICDHVREASLLAADVDHTWARDVVGLAVDSGTLVGELAVDDAVLLSVALVLAAGPRAIVVDDVDSAASVVVPVANGIAQPSRR